MISDHHVPWHQCPWCLALFDAALNLNDHKAPSDGAAMICVECGNVSLYDQSVEGSMRRPNPQEQLSLARDRRLQERLATVTLMLHEREMRDVR